MKVAARLTRFDLRRLVGETLIGERTVQAWYRDERAVGAGSAYALAAACERLGITNPHLPPRKE